MKEVSVKLLRPLVNEPIFSTELVLPEEFADLVQDWIEEWLPELLERSISLYYRLDIKTRELGEEE